MTDWPATIAPKWAIARNHAATVEEDAIREAPVMPTGGQAGRWEAIPDTTTIETSLEGEGGPATGHMFFVCRLYKENHNSLGCRGRNNRTRSPPAEPPRNVLRGTSRTGGECRFEGGDSG